MILVCRNSSNVINKLEFIYEHVRNRYVQIKIETMKNLQMILCIFFGLRILCTIIELYIPIDNYNEYIQVITIVEETMLSMIIFMLLYLLRARNYSDAYDEVNIELMQVLIKMLRLIGNLEPFVRKCVINMKKLNSKGVCGSKLIKKCCKEKIPIIIVNPEDDEVTSNTKIMSRLSIGHHVEIKKRRNKVS